MRSDLPVYLVVGSGPQSINQQAQFPIQAVLVDNPTNQFVFLPNLNRYVPPGAHGMIIKGEGSQTLQASFTTPPGTMPNVQVVGQVATITAISDPLPESSGTAQPSGFQQTQQLLTTAKVTGVGPITYNLPQGTHCLGLVVDSGSTLSVTGGTSGFVYRASVAAGYSIIEINQAIDPTVIVNLSAGGYWLAAILDAQAVRITGNPNAPVSVTIASSVATPTLSQVAGSASSVQLLAANSARKGFWLANDTTSGNLFIRFGGSAASTSNYNKRLTPGEFFSDTLPNAYTGFAIQGLWDASTGFVNITEWN